MSKGKIYVFLDDYGIDFRKVLNQIVGAQFDILSEIKPKVEVE